MHARLVIDILVGQFDLYDERSYRTGHASPEIGLLLGYDVEVSLKVNVRT